MTRDDTSRLFQLLGATFQNSAPVPDKVSIALWTEVLAPWSYSDVRAAVISWSRKRSLCPTVADLARTLPAVEERKDTPVDRKAAAWARRYHDRLRPELARHGLERFSGRLGSEYLEWRARCEAEGLDLGELVVETEVKR